MTFYGQYRFKALTEAKGATLGYIYDGLTKMGEDSFHVSCVVTTLAVSRKVITDRDPHIFIGAEVRDIILNTVSKMTFKELSTFAMEDSAGVVYVEGESPCLFSSFRNEDETSVFLNFEKEGSVLSTRYSDDETDESKAATIPDFFQRRLRMIYGLGMMKDSFPEMFKPGPPPVIKHPNWYRLLPNKTHLCVNSIRKDMAPHLRRGHFRILRSDKFKFKKGQAVFVKASMVNARAEHTSDAII